MVCAFALLDLGELAGADGGHLDRPGRIGRRLFQSVAAAQLFRLLRLLPLVCRRVAGLLGLPIGRNAARSWIPGAVLCAARAAAGLGAEHPPSRASLLLLQWEWFRIYFESGIVKLLSGDPQWRNFTAMDEYYQNGPLPTWIGWYAEHLPHWFHAASAVGPRW